VQDVIVIGAGVAGLSAAAELARHGVRPLVLEARGSLGGRTGAVAWPGTSDRIDNGQHVILGCYHETFRYLRLVGAEDRVALQPSLAVPTVDLDGRRSTLRCPRLPSPLHLLAGVLGWNALGWRDRLSVLRMTPALRRARRWAEGAGPAPASDVETVEQWLVRHGQTARLRELLWEPLALAALNQDVRHAAALPFARVLAGVFGRDTRDAAIGLPTRPLDEVFGEPARTYIESRGGSVRAHALARVHVERGRIRGVTVRGTAIPAATVIAAVPWFGLATLVAGDAGVFGATLERASALGSSPIVTVNLWLDRPVAGARFVGMPGRTFQWAFENPPSPATGVTHVSLVSSGADPVLRSPSGQLIDAAVRELRGALPEARDATLVRAGVVREPRATFSLQPGQPARPGPITPIEGFFLAGDWIDTGLPATIESAALSGRWAAEAALGRLSGGPDETRRAGGSLQIA
jgi:hydroxysqualene dehydroxylase